MRNRPAVTLIELLVVIAIIAIIVGPAVFAWTSFRARHALANSTDNLVIVLQRAHIYAREGKGDMAWGVKEIDESAYKLVSKGKRTEVTEAEYPLDPGVGFSSNFAIWFGQGTGETSTVETIRLVNKRGDSKEVLIYTTGVIEIKDI